MNDNPLAVGQRETSGPRTFGKYEYQYHWALCRIIEEHSESKNYALFMEYHEDVVIADSIDCEKAKFEFNQVKDISKPKYNINNLTKREKEKNSVLGKLLLSVNNKPYSGKISSVNLVASCGFKIDLLDNDLNLQIIRIDDLSTASIDQIKKALKEELGTDLIPESLQFVIPNFHNQGQQEFAIGKIAELVEKLFPESHCNARNIYRILIDELHRKGIVTYDYNKWDELLEKKALTPQKVHSTILTHTSLPKRDQLFEDLNHILNEIDANFIERKALRKAIERIYIERIGFPSTLSLRIKKVIKEKLKMTTHSSSDISSIISDVEDSLDISSKASIGSDLDVKAFIIYEILVSDL